jgi:hypothetical protein
MSGRGHSRVLRPNSFYKRRLNTGSIYPTCVCRAGASRARVAYCPERWISRRRCAFSMPMQMNASSSCAQRVPPAIYGLRVIKGTPCGNIESKIGCPFHWAERLEHIPFLRQIVTGPAWDESQTEAQFLICRNVILCDFLAAFIPKGRIGRHSRSISRNGLILLMNSIATPRIEGQAAELRLRIWHRCILADSPQEPYGILMTLRPIPAGNSSFAQRSLCRTMVGAGIPSDAILALDLGGNKFLSLLCEGVDSVRSVRVAGLSL